MGWIGKWMEFEKKNGGELGSVMTGSEFRSGARVEVEMDAEIGVNGVTGYASEIEVGIEIEIRIGGEVERTGRGTRNGAGIGGEAEETGIGMGTETRNGGELGSAMMGNGPWSEAEAGLETIVGTGVNGVVMGPEAGTKIGMEIGAKIGG